MSTKPAAAQIGGTYIDAVFGRLSKLVTIPTSRVYGFEVSADWRPFPGLTLTPSATYVNSKIQGSFSNFTPQGIVQSFVGEPFPYAPKWQANGNAQYKWSVSTDWSAFAGANVAYQAKTNAALGQASVYDLPAYTLVDLRAGIEAKIGCLSVLDVGHQCVRHLLRYQGLTVVRLRHTQHGHAGTLRRDPELPLEIGS